MAGDVRTSGPFFDGRFGSGIDRMLRDVEEQIAEEGINLVRSRLGSVLKNPSGYYSSRISSDGGRVHDGGVIYGPWLEGVGSRNQTTRFKGYATFRKTTQELERRSEDIAEDVVRAHIGELN
jgi:hypothetical protein